MIRLRFFHVPPLKYIALALAPLAVWAVMVFPKSLISGSTTVAIPNSMNAQVEKVGKNGGMFVFTRIATETSCFMHVFTSLTYPDSRGQSQHNMPDAEVSHSGPCNAWDEVSLWTKLGQAVMDAAQKLGLQGDVYNTCVGPILEDIKDFAIEAVSRVFLGGG